VRSGSTQHDPWAGRSAPPAAEAAGSKGPELSGSEPHASLMVTARRNAGPHKVKESVGVQSSPVRLAVEAFRTDALRQGFLATRNTGQPISVRQAALLSVSRGVTR
jgi:hypothetical protein